MPNLSTDEFISRKKNEDEFPTSHMASKKANDAVYLIEISAYERTHTTNGNSPAKLHVT